MPVPKFNEMGQTTRPYLSISQDTVDLLERITPAEKAQAVPYLKIWRIDPATGEPVHGRDGIPTGPLSSAVLTPPSFGAGADVRRRESPPVSFQRATIRTQSPRGIILFRQIDLAFTVHRPEIIFQEAEADRDSWSDLLMPGFVFAMEYGWVASAGVKNPLMNGEGFDGDSALRKENPRVIVPAISRIRFVVTHYDFKMAGDRQITVTIKAVEDGELNIRQAFIGGPKQEVSGGKVSFSSPLDPYSAEGQKQKDQLEKLIKDKIFDPSKVKKGSKGYDDLIKFKDLCDVLFAPVISEAYKALGYNEPQLWLGNFSSKNATLIHKYGGTPMADKSIGEFTFPKRRIPELFSQIQGTQITLQNFLTVFLSKMMAADIWTASKGLDERMPVLQCKVVTNKKDVNFYIIDMNRELTRFFPNDRENFKLQLAGRKPTKADVKRVLREKGVPLISFGHGNSYIQDSDFSVMSDDPIKTLLIVRGLKEASRTDRVNKTELQRKVEEARPKMLYSSAIKGDVTMIGNFAFDTFGLVWLDFDVPVWSGPFFIQSKTDTIDRTGFVSSFSLYSSGEDPLGTKAGFAESFVS